MATTGAVSPNADNLCAIMSAYFFGSHRAHTSTRQVWFPMVVSDAKVSQAPSNQLWSWCPESDYLGLLEGPSLARRRFVLFAKSPPHAIAARTSHHFADQAAVNAETHMYLDGLLGKHVCGSVGRGILHELGLL